MQRHNLTKSIASFLTLCAVFFCWHCGSPARQAAERDIDNLQQDSASPQAPGELDPADAQAQESPPARGEGTSDGDGADPEPVDENASLETPGADGKALLKRGRRKFERYCGTCHPGGDEDLGPRLIGMRLPAKRMQRQIRRGSGKMKPISKRKLSEANLKAIMAYLQKIRAVRAPIL